MRRGEANLIIDSRNNFLGVTKITGKLFHGAGGNRQVIGSSSSGGGGYGGEIRIIK